MSSYSNKVHNSHGNVPFSWEKKPGVSKETTQITTKKFLMEDLDDDHDHHDDHDYDHQDFVLKLPPCRRARASFSSPVPPPPGVDQQPSLRSSSMRGLRKQGGHDQDPFLAAFKVCTKSSVKTTHGNYRSDFMSGLRSLFAVAPCKRPESCDVREGNLVRVSHQLDH